MKKKWEKPIVEIIEFTCEDIITTSGDYGHFDANGKWHEGGHGNQHYGGINFEGPNEGNGLG